VRAVRIRQSYLGDGYNERAGPEPLLPVLPKECAASGRAIPSFSEADFSGTCCDGLERCSEIASDFVRAVE
jgi:hypothetical protein